MLLTFSSITMLTDKLQLDPAHHNPTKKSA